MDTYLYKNIFIQPFRDNSYLSIENVCKNSMICETKR